METDNARAVRSPVLWWFCLIAALCLAFQIASTLTWRRHTALSWSIPPLWPVLAGLLIGTIVGVLAYRAISTSQPGPGRGAATVLFGLAVACLTFTLAILVL